MPGTGSSLRSLAGYLAGIAIGTASITLLFLGMRAVMDVGGACAEGGPYVSAQPCPTGVPIAMIGGMFGLFGAAGLIVWFGAHVSAAAASVVALGWPALFLTLGFNFVDYANHPPDAEPTPVWGWLIPGVIFWLMGAAPLVLGVAAIREARAGRPGNRLSRQIAAGGWLPTRNGREGRDVNGEAVDRAPDPSARPIEGVDFAPAARSGWAVPAATPAANAGPVATIPLDPARGIDVVDDLTRLAALHASGELSDEEFAAAKRERLADSGPGR